MTIAELKTGDRVTGLEAMIEKKTEGKTKSDKPFLRLTIRDLSGSLECVFWEFDPEIHAFPEGSVVAIDGSLSTYNGALQLGVQRLCASPRPVSDFAKRTKFVVEKLWKDVLSTIETFHEPLTQWVTRDILCKPEFVDAFKQAPAAKGVHNAWYGGLLEHVWSLCSLAEPVIAHYKTNYFPQLSRDKVLFGLILHDAGKIFEYDYKTPAFGYTGEGVFTNHLVLGSAWVYASANKWWEKHSAQAGWDEGLFKFDEGQFKMERAHLMHLLAAHHGTLEWGSPVKPSSIEAILVHFLDNTDSKVLHALELVQGKEGQIQGFSERSRFEQTSYYQPKI